MELVRISHYSKESGLSFLLDGLFTKQTEFQPIKCKPHQGHIIAFQLEEHMKKTGKVGPEFERVARQGALSPDLWMKGAVGSPVGPEALIAATEDALNRLEN